MWEANIQDDKFALIYEMNKNCKVTVKTPVGETSEIELNEIEMQGTVLAPLKCSIQTDSIAKHCYLYQKGIYIYKNSVHIPPLWMIDDCITFSLCGTQSIILNQIINSRISMKKLQLSNEKCKNMHFGKQKSNCSDLVIRDAKMQKCEELKYLGDWISTSTKNDFNIEKRANKCIGTISQLMSLLRQVSLGFYQMEIALIFRDTMLISQLLFNSEVWLDLKQNQIAKLTAIDELYLFKILNVPRTVTKECLYTEIGKYPVTSIIKMRRLMYWWHILQQKEEELIHRVYQAQVRDPEPNDFICQIKGDKSELKISLSDSEVKLMSKNKFKTFIKSKIDTFLRRQFDQKKEMHSKSKYAKSFKQKPQEYFFSMNLNLKQIQILFRLRTHMLSEAKLNFKGSFGENIWCSVCSIFPESQEHIFTCSEIRREAKDIQIPDSCKYSHLDGTLQQQEEFTKNFCYLLEVRKQILEERNSPFYREGRSTEDLDSSSLSDVPDATVMG